MEAWFSALISAYGYGAVCTIVALESMGLPLPGETVLVIAARYAGPHPDLSIAGVIAAAAAGAILGDNVGNWLGREFGYRLLLRYGRYVGISDLRIDFAKALKWGFGHFDTCVLAISCHLHVAPP